MPNKPIPQFRSWLKNNADQYDAVIFDIDGVLIKGRRPVDGAAELIAFLRQNNIPFALLTNDSCHSPEEKTLHLREGGVDVYPHELSSCCHGLRELKERNNWNDEQFFVMGSIGDPCYGYTAGLHITKNTDDLPNCTGVIVGEKEYDWHKVINSVYNFFLQHPDRPLIIPNPDAYYPSAPGEMGIAAGAIGRFVVDLCSQCGVNLKPIYLGKPYEPIFSFNHHRFEKKLNKPLIKQRVIMLGDSLTSDIPGSLNFGYTTGLMLTGITDMKMLEESNLAPSYIFQSL